MVSYVAMLLYIVPACHIVVASLSAALISFLELPLQVSVPKAPPVRLMDLVAEATAHQIKVQ
jgi:hypothetical protein